MKVQECHVTKIQMLNSAGVHVLNEMCVRSF